MKPFATEHYLVYPQAESQSQLEVAISDYFHPIREGPFWFQEPLWHLIDEDKIVKTPLEEWTLARLLHLWQRENSGLTIDAIVETDEDVMHVPMLVTGMQQDLAAQLWLVVSEYEWRGFAKTYLDGKAALAELGNRLFAEPSDLAKYELYVPGRRKFGWTGKRFLGQRTIHRPAYYSKECVEERRKQEQELESRKPIQPKFVVREYPAAENAPIHNAAKRPLRFTDIYPPPDLWNEYPNWRFALDEEGRAGQDETTLKPARTQSYIVEEVDYTAAEAWLADGRSFPALIYVTDCEPRAATLFLPDSIWHLDNLGIQTNDVELTSDQITRFPVRIVSRLGRSRRRGKLSDPIVIDVFQDGKTVAHDSR